MKKLTYILIVLVAAALSTACTKEDGTVRKKSPKISISLKNQVPVNVYPGENVDFVFSMKYAKGIRSAYATADGHEIEGTRKEFADTPDSTGLEFSYMAKDVYAGNSVDIAVVAEAVDGAAGHYDWPLFILAAKSSIEIKLPENAPEEFEVNGETLSFDVSIVSSNVDMKKITTYKGETAIPEMTYEIDGDLRNHTLHFSYTPTLGDTGSPVVFSFEIMDVNGNLTNAYYSVRFFKAASTELNEYSGVSLGMQKCPTAGQFLNARANEVYMANGVGEKCADVNIVVFWSNNAGTQGAAFASPNVSNVSSAYSAATIAALGGTEADAPVNWKVRQETTFRDVDIDADTFAAVNTVADIESLYASGTKPSNEHVTFQKKAGKVMAFCANKYELDPEGKVVTDEEGIPVIAESKYGIIRITGNAGNNTQKITFDYKIEK